MTAATRSPSLATKRIGPGLPGNVTLIRILFPLMMTLTRAMHSRFIEQYTELQENYNELVTKHSVTMAGINVKKAATKAAINGCHGKRFAKAFSAELFANRAGKEKERELLQKGNKNLRTQLLDTAEAVQAASELLVRLGESEQA